MTPSAQNRSPQLLQHHAAYCRLLLRATRCLMQQAEHTYVQVPLPHCALARRRVTRSLAGA